MRIEFDEKFIRNIKIIAISLTVLAIFCMGISIYQTNKFMKNINNSPEVKEVDTVITEWLVDYQNDKAVQEQWQRDVRDAEIRLDEIDRQYHITMGDSK